MNSIILCEGSTDYALLQYFMREVYNWNDDKSIQGNVLKSEEPSSRSRKLKRDSGDTLTIFGVGGKSRFGQGFEQVIEHNLIARPDTDELYSKIAIITDRDDENSEEDMIRTISDVILKCGTEEIPTLQNNKWCSFFMINNGDTKIKVDVLLLVIPFEVNGAMETFLLNAVCEADKYDSDIIKKCSDFVEIADPDKKYLKSNRYIVKAKYDTYFSVRTAAEQFNERQNILKNVDWKSYLKIQKDFKKLEEL